MINPLLNQIKAARRVSVPIVAITTPDPAATIEAIDQAIRATARNADGEETQAPKIIWDAARGLRPRNDEAKAAIAEMLGSGGGDYDPTVGNPAALFAAAEKLPKESILFVHAANRWLNDPMTIQALWNLRDRFKVDRRMVILLGPSMDLPPELAGDVVVFDEPLPGPEQLEEIIRQQHDAAELALAGPLDKAVEAVQGLPAFQAEQVVAMSLTKAGLDIPNLWERKRRQIELTPGLKVFRGKDGFESVGGLSQVKRYLTDLMDGASRPNAITWLDEIDKALPTNQTADTSGVSQDQLGTILTYMEDHNVLGVLLLGPPGSGKSAIAKAAGNAGGIPTVRFDLGACKGSLVGESEGRIRQALRVISAVSNDRSMFIATANSVAGLDSALKRRFPFIFYFDLPTREEKDAIWKIWRARYSVLGPEPSDDGWSAANIQKCCECAWRLGRSLKDAARYIVPCARVSGREIEALRKQADGVYLSASCDGVYTQQTEREQTATRSRARRHVAVGEE